jgi:hypothetical protein
MVIIRSVKRLTAFGMTVDPADDFLRFNMANKTPITLV